VFERSDIIDAVTVGFDGLILSDELGYFRVILPLGILVFDRPKKIAMTSTVLEAAIERARPDKRLSAAPMRGY